MSFLVSFARFWYDFIVGDDWTIALAVVIALVVTAALARVTTSGVAWWILPLAVIVVLGASLWRIAQKGR